MAHPTQDGRDRPGPALAGRCIAHGFTLVEILIVLVIAGTVLAYVSLKIFPDDREALSGETRRVAALFDHARGEAIATGRSIAWIADARGYGFWHKDDNQQWTQPAGDELLHSRALAPGVTIVSLEVQRAEIPLNSGLVFSSSGLNAPFRLELAARERRTAVVGDAAGRIRIRAVP